MKQFIEDHKLKNMTVPTVEHSPRQADLRRVLVSRAAERADKELSMLQGVINFMKKRTLLTGAGIAGMLAVAVLAFSAVGPSKSANALQLATDSSKALQTILNEENTAGMSEAEITYKKYAPQFAEWLSRAQQADDLRVLTYDQVVASYPNTERVAADSSLRVIDNPRDGQSPVVRELKYLEFTMTDGDARYKIVVGVNEQNIPEAALMHIVQTGSPRGGA